MKVISFDLELNQAKTGAKIIEVGACIGDTDTREVLEEYSSIVNPHEILEEHIITLTGITQAEVDGGATINQAYLGMVDMFKKYDKIMTNPIVWGAGDGFALRNELSCDVKWVFGRRELDVKAVFQAYMIASTNNICGSGLWKSLKRLKLQFVGKQHRAKDDAINTFYIFCSLLDILRLGHFEMF